MDQAFRFYALLGRLARRDSAFGALSLGGASSLFSFLTVSGDLEEGIGQDSPDALHDQSGTLPGIWRDSPAVVAALEAAIESAHETLGVFDAVSLADGDDDAQEEKATLDAQVASIPAAARPALLFLLGYVVGEGNLADDLEDHLIPRLDVANAAEHVALGKTAREREFDYFKAWEHVSLPKEASGDLAAYRAKLAEGLEKGGIPIDSIARATEASLRDRAPHTLLVWFNTYNIAVDFYELPDAKITPALREALGKINYKCFRGARDLKPDTWCAALRVMATLDYRSKTAEGFFSEWVEPSAASPALPTREEIAATYGIFCDAKVSSVETNGALEDGKPLLVNAITHAVKVRKD
ncbi:MAG: hypothetical protein ABI551_14020 [Polyangiaceae bacterium]